MLWWVVVGVLVLLSLGAAVAYGFWIGHKLSDLTAELGVLGEQAERLADLVGQVQLEPQAPADGWAGGSDSSSTGREQETGVART